TKVKLPKAGPSHKSSATRELMEGMRSSAANPDARLNPTAKPCCHIGRLSPANKTINAPSHGSPMMRAIRVNAMSASQRGNLRHIQRAKAAADLHSQRQPNNSDDGICNDDGRGSGLTQPKITA